MSEGAGFQKNLPRVWGWGFRMSSTTLRRETLANSGVSIGGNVEQHILFGMAAFPLPFSAKSGLDGVAVRGGSEYLMADLARFAHGYSKDVSRSGQHSPRAWIPADNAAGLLAKRSRLNRARPAVWAAFSENLPDSTLYPHIKKLLGGQKRDAIRRFKLTDQARGLIEKASVYSEKASLETRRVHELILTLPASRVGLAVSGQSELSNLGAIGSPIKDKRYYRVLLRDVELYAFRTDIAVAVAEISIQTLHDGVLSLQELGAAARELAVGKQPLHWRVAKGSDMHRPVTDGFALHDVLGGLVPSDLGNGRVIPRTFFYSFASLLNNAEASDADQLPLNATEAAKAMAWRSALDDRGSEGDADPDIIVEGNQVAHAVSLEGAASVSVAPVPTNGDTGDKRVQKLKDDATKTYVPIAVLNLHELCASLRISERASFWPAVDQKMAHEVQQKLEKIRDQALGLRLTYRFAEISPRLVCRAFHHGLRKQFGLSHLEAEISRDMSEVNEFLAAKDMRHLERRFRLPHMIMGGATAAILGFHLGEKFAPKIIKATAMNQNLGHIDHDIIGLVTAALFCAVGAIAAGGKSRRKSREADDHHIPTSTKNSNSD
jgi:hypothetical protein